MEIKPRIQVLNERCRVFLDLAEILSDAIADKKMTRKLWNSFFLHQCPNNALDITWIIIILILISIFVTCSEVFLRFGLLHTKPGMHAPTIASLTSSNNKSILPSLIPHSTTRGIARVGLVTSWILIGTSML
jgi:hypothetical protein